MAIDSHIHISQTQEDMENIIFQVQNNRKIEAIINVGMNLDTSLDALYLTKLCSKFYAAVGLHPLYVDAQDCNQFLNLGKDPKVVAIGEIGLDSGKDNLLLQKVYLIRQIQIANELGLPVIIHANNTNKEVIDTFRRFEKPKYGCVFHCFQPDLQTFDYLMENDYYISFAGRITYPTAKKSLEIAKLVPDDKFLVETDYPYITTYNTTTKEKRDSAKIYDTIKVLAHIKNQSIEEIDRKTVANTKRLFKKLR